MLKALTAWRARRVGRTFSRYLKADQVAKLAREPEKPILGCTDAWFCCLLVQVRDDTLEEAQRNVAKVVPFYLDGGGIIVEMMASIQLVTFGAPHQWNEGKTAEDFLRQGREVSAAVLNALGKDVRIVFFAGEFALGLIGNQQRVSYTLVAPRFDQFFKALLETEFGCITELPFLPPEAREAS